MNTFKDFSPSSADRGDGEAPPPLTPYLLALQERFGAVLGEETVSPIELLVDDEQPLSIHFNFEKQLVIVVTPLENVSRESSSSFLSSLLEKNFPNNDVAGAIIQIKPEEQIFELVNIIPLKSLDPSAVAGISVNQALSALKLSRSFAQKLASSQDESLLSRGSESDFGSFSFLEMDR